MFWVSKQITKKNKKTYWVKRGVATKRFLLSICVLQNVKSYRFFGGGPFLGKCLLMLKKHYKYRCFSTFLKANNGKQ